MGICAGNRETAQKFGRSHVRVPQTQM